MLGCGVLLAFPVVGAAVGAQQGGVMGGVVGALAGAGALVVLAGLGLWLGVRKFKRWLGSMDDDGEPLPLPVRAKAAAVLALHRTVAARFGVSPPGAIFGHLYPSKMPATDKASRGLLVAADDDRRRADVEGRIKRVWLASLDAEVAGRPRASVKPQFDQLQKYLEQQAR